MQHVTHNGQQISQGEEFEPMPGYRVIFVRDEGSRLILRDSAGEFSRPIRPHTDQPRPAAPVKLGARRTVLEEVPDARPIVDETIYLMTHQMCVPGGWQDITSTKLRGPRGQAGVYGPAGQMMEVGGLRDSARRMFEAASKQLAKHPYTRLDELLTKLRLQEGTGEVGGWDDPGVGFEVAELLAKANTL
ncbi:hypothetical protein ABZ281_02590 [Streptomyces sp. NPDC006265]|uniref:hypothetical protein n=1 Tax=Streptomyces sp. NPDC006265 TaxID=3156740 RepID=UPI0033B6CC6F